MMRKNLTRKPFLLLYEDEPKLGDRFTSRVQYQEMEIICIFWEKKFKGVDEKSLTVMTSVLEEFSCSTSEIVDSERIQTLQ